MVYRASEEQERSDLLYTVYEATNKAKFVVDPKRLQQRETGGQIYNILYVVIVISSR